ncbi:MAG: 7-carboxy-7-deazaguanine synthase QueE [Oscillatoria sp. PMC 1051.18]|uniref:7-carboxy-7-deazaguanine synthase QueE n=1 Tax=Oscillatoria salina TaxID=331517 RepID=UPI0013B64AFC|nr:7-carboxy-7-deazaguanine synthase QueE [Oscillatoria salina]MBZ8179911.1 7-carboxy-7-deazaguanine synthase QueE [Oscillatoria salina IIICB1]MEC4891999.1 7-carboxy-7-deazaguanine synthase QueE [Oscillatoria sp. PMC 1050.18]MEC5028625.1 7-carboxy-7-deazaguanine synthase QueE [Oscillatoria sp. PMC 1051.18]NET87458.1 7-carboxy-7-deazaguanine synthase QueE [Kamptonema sp. SIO1D9]
MTELTEQKARLVELFSAIQGEGFNVGSRQIFIRFAVCDLRCHFCDSANTWSVPSTCRIEKTPGLRDFEIHSNPVKLLTLLNWVERQNLPRLHDSVSLTGGEPLLHARFLQEFLPKLKDVTQLSVYLETGGHRSQELSLVLPYLNSVGMDIKLPSVSGEEHWQSHRLFLQRCFDASVQVFVKLIISDRTNPDELIQAAELVAAVSPEIPVFLQPVTSLQVPLAAGAVLPPSPEQVLAWQKLMKNLLLSVRVVPQTHKYLAQL